MGISELSIKRPVFAVVMSLLLIVLGVYPKPALDVITPAVQSTIVDSSGGQR